MMRQFVFHFRLTAFISAGLMIGLALMLRGEFILRSFRPEAWNWIVLLTGIGSGALTATLGIVGWRNIGWVRRLLPAEIMELVRAMPSATWWAAAICGAVAEEILFRGGLQYYLGILATNLLFGFMHYFAQRQLVGYGLAAFFMGIMLSLSFLWTGSLLMVIGFHLTHNLVVSLWIRRTSADPLLDHRA